MKFDVIQWSPPLSDCMAKLAESHETPADEILIALAKIARVSEDVARNCKGPEDREKAAASPTVFLKAYLNALEQVKQGLSPGVLQDGEHPWSISAVETLLTPRDRRGHHEHRKYDDPDLRAGYLPPAPVSLFWLRI